ncbi:MAG: NADH-quinone oxidoreductase subunit NuoN [Alphaproteobacteria bacterium]|nr:NADH-quinone oxidoreductase subunit NuoN [Alphaproteobacteria bacterium]
MTSLGAADLVPVIPELFLATAGMALLMLGVFRGDGSTRFVSTLSVLSLAIAFLLLGLLPEGRTEAFAGMFVTDAFAVFVKSLVLLGSALTIVMSSAYIRSERMERFEFPVLVLFATLGMMMMVSANDLMSLYLGLELQSLALYVLAAFKRESTRATEAGLKYFVLGALSSGMLLYGCSLIYGFAGTTSFPLIAGLFAGGVEVSIGLIVGIVFLTAGLAFKVSAVPFHMWTPDVYEGAPTAVTAFFAVAPKIAALGLFVRAMIAPFGELADEWRQIIVLLSVASIALGAVAAIGQSNIKRLMAYSSIGHVGYALIGLAAGTQQGVRGVLIYLAIYLAMNVGAFAVILSMRVKNGMVERIEDLGGLAQSRPMMAAAMAIFMFSLAGIPPLAGFFAKFYVLAAAIDAGLYALAVIGVIGSVVGAYYYLRIIKIMYIDPQAEPLEKPMHRELGVVLTVSALFTLLFFAYPAPLLAGAEAAAASLLSP